MEQPSVIGSDVTKLASVMLLLEYIQEKLPSKVLGASWLLKLLFWIRQLKSQPSVMVNEPIAQHILW